MNYYRRYMGDFQAATMALTLMEQGAYDRLLDYYYATEKPIPLNSDRAAIICRAVKLEERAAVDAVLNQYFERRTDGWHNKRADHEITVSKVARNNGGKGGRPKKIHEDDDGCETLIQGECETGMETGCETETITGLVTESTPGSGHPPTTNHQPPSTSLQPPERSPRASRLSPDWKATPDQLAWAMEERPDWDEAQARRAAESFRDHWIAKPGKDGTKLDWDATWRNWVRRETGGKRLRAVHGGRMVN